MKLIEKNKDIGVGVKKLQSSLKELAEFKIAEVSKTDLIGWKTSTILLKTKFLRQESDSVS